MPEKPKTIDEIEELSRLLDEMNAGRQPECENKETAELLAVADLIKKSAGPVCPPPHILNQIVDRSLMEIQAGKTKSSKAWWYSGALSTAVAVMLVVGLNVMPVSSPQPPTVPPQANRSEQQSAAQIKQNVKQPPLLSQQTPRQEATVPETPPRSRENQPQAAPQNPSPPVPLPPPTKSLKLPDVSKAVPIIGEQIPPASQSKSAYSPSVFADTGPATTPPVLSPLSLPGQVANLIVTDTQKGIIRQIYYKGTAQELIVTQRLLSKTAGDMQRQAQAKSITELVEDKPGLINTVTVIKFDQEVTIEGRQPKQILEKIAESLTK